MWHSQLLLGYRTALQVPMGSHGLTHKYWILQMIIINESPPLTASLNLSLLTVSWTNLDIAWSKYWYTSHDLRRWFLQYLAMAVSHSTYQKHYDQRALHPNSNTVNGRISWSPAYSICVHRRTYGVQCSDKVRFLQLHIKCGIANSCPGTVQLCRRLWARMAWRTSHRWFLGNMVQYRSWHTYFWCVAMW